MVQKHSQTHKPAISKTNQTTSNMAENNETFDILNQTASFFHSTTENTVKIKFFWS